LLGVRREEMDLENAFDAAGHEKRGSNSRFLYSRS